MFVSLIIPGKPLGKQRPRITRFGVAYTPTQTVNYETLVKQLYIINKLPKIEGYVEAEIVAYFPIPKSVSKKQRQMMLNNEVLPSVKPDCDNIIKIILDALNKLAYDDDKQVVNLSFRKFYSDDPRVEISLGGI